MGEEIKGVRAWQRDGMAAAALAAFACWAPTFPDALLLGFARLAALLALAGCTGLAAQAAETLKVWLSCTRMGLGVPKGMLGPTPPLIPTCLYAT